MNRVYQSPPLIEALCEFQFAERDWDMTVLGLMYQEVHEQFPLKRQLQGIEWEMQAEKGQINQRFVGAAPRMQFLRNDEQALIQVGPGLLSVNHLQPYPHWGLFKRMIFDALAAYRRVAQPTNFTRIGLRYINRIKLPGDFSQYAGYLQVGPHLPAGVRSDIASLVLRVELPHPDDRGTLLLTVATAPEMDAPTAGVILDLDFVTSAATELSFDAAEEWVELAHNRIEATFEACLTDKLRTMFMETMT